MSVAYYGIFVWVPAKLAGNGFGFVHGYGFLLIVTLAQLPGYALAAYGVEAWGRRKTLIDGRVTRHPGYAISQRIRKRIEEVFGWVKTVGHLAKTRHRGVERVGWMFTLAATAFNLVRLPKLLATG